MSSVYPGAPRNAYNYDMHFVVALLGVVALFAWTRQHRPYTDGLIVLSVAVGTLTVFLLDRNFPSVRPGSMVARLRRRVIYLVWPILLLVASPLSWWEGQ